MIDEHAPTEPNETTGSTRPTGPAEDLHEEEEPKAGVEVVDEDIADPNEETQILERPPSVSGSGPEDGSPEDESEAPTNTMATTAGDYIIDELSRGGKIGSGPDQLAPGIHSHNGDEIVGLNTEHHHESVDIVDFAESVLRMVSADVVKDRLKPMMVPGQEGGIVRESHTHEEPHGGHHGHGQRDEIDVSGLNGELAAPQKPKPHNHKPGDFSVNGFDGTLKKPQIPVLHAKDHMAGKDDQLDVGGLPGELADPQKPKPHGHKPGDFRLEGFEGVTKTPQTPSKHSQTHGQSGSDPLNVDGLPGVLAQSQNPAKHIHSANEFSLNGFRGVLKDAQPPKDHSSMHRANGSDPLDVTGLPGVLDHPQKPAKHAAGHAKGQPDQLNVSGLPGVLAEPQPPRGHADQHGADAKDRIDLTRLPGIPAALAEHAGKSGGVHGCAGPIESSANRGKAGGYASLDGKGYVEQLPVIASAEPGPDRMPIADDHGTLNRWVSATPERIREIAENVVAGIIPQPESGELMVSRGEEWDALGPGMPGQVLMTDGERDPVWGRVEDSNTPPWVGRFYAASGDCDPVKFMNSLTSRAVGDGPAPNQFGQTVRAVLFRPPAGIDVHTIYMIGMDESIRQYQIGIYKDEEDSQPLIVADVNTQRGMFGVNIPVVKLNAGTDYWFCLAAATSGTRGYLRSQVNPAFPITGLRGIGMPVFVEWDIEGNPWGPLPEQHVPIRAMGQHGGTMPLAFLSGG